MDNREEIPEWLKEMSKQMNEQSSRYTSHPFWQVRCKRYVPTESGYNEHHWILADGEGEFYRSDKDPIISAAEYFSDNYSEWFCSVVDNAKEFDESFEDMEDTEVFANSFDFDYEELPEGVNKVFVQEQEEVVTTHLTKADAMWFIKRKQHDYPPLYIYVESAYWSPQLKQLQDWIKALTSTESIDEKN